jgi:hypothetical protein
MNFFDGKKVVIATMHKKERVISRLLHKAFGVESFVPTDFNTDTFGTFTRDIKREGDQLEAARKKAKAALEKSGADIAIASEGSFSPHPSFPFVSSNLELVLLVDKESGIEVRGRSRTSDTNHSHKKVSSVEEVLAFAKEIGFPEHGIIVRKSETSRKIYKEITSSEELEDISKKLLSGFFTKSIFLEADMRAHRNPTRMKAIEEATLDLIKNIKSTCPDCGAPGFIKTTVIKGLPCSSCGLDTDIPGIFLYECQMCHKQEERKEKDFADPVECAFCNP